MLADLNMRKQTDYTDFALACLCDRSGILIQPVTAPECTHAIRRTTRRAILRIDCWERCLIRHPRPSTSLPHRISGCAEQLRDDLTIAEANRR